MVLVQHPDNPVPPGAVSGHVETSDGVRIRFARWPATGGPLKGTVTLLHGRAEFIEQYFETIADLTARGYAVATFDWRGQGGSGRLLADPRRGHVDDFADYLRDLDAVLTKVVLADMPGPHFALAHSTGGAVLLLGAARLRTRFERAVLAAPLLGLGRIGIPQNAVSPLAKLLSAIGLGTAFVPGGGANDRMDFDGNPLTSDPVRFARTLKVLDLMPDLEIGSPTIDWLAAACRTMGTLFHPGFGPTLNLPVLIVAAGCDQVVSTPAAERFARITRSARYLEIAGARHELLMERDVYRDPFLAAFEAFASASQ